MCKGIFGIRDLTKIRRTIRENVRYLSGSTGLKSYLGSGIFQNFGKGCGILWPVCCGFGKSYKNSFTNERS